MDKIVKSHLKKIMTANKKIKTFNFYLYICVYVFILYSNKTILFEESVKLYIKFHQITNLK